MKTILLLFQQVIILLSFGICTSQDNPEFKKIAGFSHPESVVYEKTGDFLFVSNIGGETSGDGYISKVSLEGQILDSLWVRGLDDPKGLLIQEGKLFVTDNKRIVEMDIDLGQISREYSIEEAGMLNDIAADADGNLYISDTRKNSIFKLDTLGIISEWMNSKELQAPNGLLFSKNELWVAAWGNGETGGDILKIDPDTQEIQKVSEKGIGNLDGLQQGKAGDFYFSDWQSGKIFRIEVGGKIKEVVTSARSVGDILLLEEKGLLILPMNLQNEVWWYSLQN